MAFFGLICGIWSIHCFLVAHNVLRHDENPIQKAIYASQSPILEASSIYPVEPPIENPPFADGNSTFSACLLVMDDNHRLIEWLAYHWHVLPLRYLVVTVDPRSTTSPSSIWNKWRRKGMRIIEWVDTDFWRPNLELREIPDNATLQTKRDRHRGRQKYFYRSCLIHMKDMNRTWVSLHDTDEYLVYNHAGGERFQAWEANRAALHAQSKHREHQRVQPSQTPPTTAEQGGMIKYIRQEQAAGLDYYQSPCIGVPRLQFAAQESPSATIQQDAAASYDPRLFDTLRWRYHALRNDFVKNALGKVLLDVSRIDMRQTPLFQSLHRPIKTICGAPWHNDWDSGLRINHYLGSWESYSFRTADARKGFERSREQWEFKSLQSSDATDDVVRPWLSGFVETEADHEDLLEYVGYVPPHATEGFHLLVDKLEAILQVDETVANDNKKVAFDAYVRDKYKNKTDDGAR